MCQWVREVTAFDLFALVCAVDLRDRCTRRCPGFSDWSTIFLKGNTFCDYWRKIPGLLTVMSFTQGAEKSPFGIALETSIIHMYLYHILTSGDTYVFYKFFFFFLPPGGTLCPKPRPLTPIVHKLQEVFFFIYRFSFLPHLGLTREANDDERTLENSRNSP